jgi:hypothetical protein
MGLTHIAYAARGQVYATLSAQGDALCWCISPFQGRQSSKVIVYKNDNVSPTLKGNTRLQVSALPFD